MVKTKSDVQRILDKIEGEMGTAEEFEKKYEKYSGNYDYFYGKKIAFRDLKTWIQENILEEA